MTMTILPVPCPECGEAQNVIPENFDPEGEPFGPGNCMGCGRGIARDVYLAGLKKRLIEMARPT